MPSAETAPSADISHNDDALGAITKHNTTQQVNDERLDSTAT